MTNYNPELPKFLGVRYDPDDKEVPGCITIKCLYEEIPPWTKERGAIFQYLEGELFFLVFPTLVQLPLGKASSVEEAIEMAKQFLRKWLSLDPKYFQFRIDTLDAILQLEEEKRKEEEARKKAWLERYMPIIEKALEEHHKKSSKS